MDLRCQFRPSRHIIWAVTWMAILFGRSIGTQSSKLIWSKHFSIWSTWLWQNHEEASWTPFAHCNVDEKNNVPVVLSTLASNYAGWEPNRFVICYSLEAKKRKKQFVEDFRRGLELEGYVPDKLLNERLIIDGIHPNLEGYLLIGETIADKIRSSFSKRQGNLNMLDAETAKKVFHSGQSKIFEVSYQTGRWIVRLSTWLYNPNERLRIAETFFGKQSTCLQRYEGFLGLAVISWGAGKLPEGQLTS